jgi:DNA-binding IclR family transcriptional regulator
MSDTTKTPQTRDSNYACTAQQRYSKVMLTLAGHEVMGLSLTEIVNALAAHSGKGGQKNNVFRDLHNLKLAGLAEQLPDSDRWRLGPKIVQIGLAHLRYMERATARLEETKHRYSREPI